MAEARMRHCAQCGAELGVIDRRYWMPGDTCGARDCERGAREDEYAQREQGHEDLDNANGWDR